MYCRTICIVIFNKIYLKSNNIHSSATIASNVKIGDNVTIAANVVIYDNVSIEDGVIIEANSVIGASPKTVGAQKGNGWTILKSKSYIGENCVIDAPIKNDTIISENSYIMPFVYIGHDSIIHQNSILSSGVKVGGYVNIDRNCNIGLNVSIHQFSTIGAFAMIGMGAIVNKDIPPFSKAFGIPIRYKGLNKIGMERAGLNNSIIQEISEYINGLNENFENPEWIRYFENFTTLSKRTKLICR